MQSIYWLGCLKAEQNWRSWSTPFITWKNAKLFPQRTGGVGLPCRKPLLLLNCLLEEEAGVKFKVNGWVGCTNSSKHVSSQVVRACISCGLHQLLGEWESHQTSKQIKSLGGIQQCLKSKERGGGDVYACSLLPHGKAPVVCDLVIWERKQGIELTKLFMAREPHPPRHSACWENN